MLEKQIGEGQKSEVNDKRPVTDDEDIKETNIVDLIQKKPTYGKSRRKPTRSIKFKKKLEENNE